MKLLELTNGGVTLVDDDIYELVKQHNWRRDSAANHVVRTTGPKKNRRLIRLHRFVMKAQSGQIVDHVNGDVLDNRRENLRFADKSTNAMNRGKQINNKSGYKGVSWSHAMKKWHAQMMSGVKKVLSSYHSSKEEAHEAYKEAALIFHREYAKF
jgi:hypothetical protein